MKELKLIPPTDPRVQCAIAPFNNDMLKDEGFKDRKDLGASEIKTLDKLEERYSNCEKYERLLTGNNDNIPCILETEKYPLPIFYRIGLSRDNKFSAANTKACSCTIGET